MKVVLAALNARYAHTAPAVRALKAYVCAPGREHPFPAEDLFIHETHINRPADDSVRDLVELDADVYGFSCAIWNIQAILRICSDLNRIRPEARILLGGPEVAGSKRARELMEQHQEIDWIIRGEGEAPLSSLLALLQDGGDAYDSIPGLVWRSMGTVHETQPGSPVDPADWAFPYPENPEDAEHRLLYYESSRGCPFACAYCLSALDRSLRFRPLDLVKEELGRLARMPSGTVKFVDRTFNADPVRAVALWTYLSGLDTPVRFHFEIGAHLLDDASLNALASAPAGRFQLEIGIQSIHPEVLAAVHRHAPVEKALERVQWLRDHTKIPVHLDLIAGLPGASETHFSQSFNRVYALRPDRLQCGILKILPGAPMEHMAQERGYRYSAYPPYAVFSSDALTYPEMSRIHDVAHVLDVYDNSGAFSESMRRLMDANSNPYRLYSELAKRWRDGGLFHRGVSRDEAAACLLRYAAEIGQPVPQQVRTDLNRFQTEREWARFAKRWQLTPEQSGIPEVPV